MAIVIAGLLYIVVYLLKIITFPSIDTINIGAISDEAFLFIAASG